MRLLPGPGLLGVLVLAALVSWSGARPASGAEGGTPTAQPQTTAEQQLADRYAPVVIMRKQDSECGPGEPYRPVPVAAVLGQPDVVLRGPDGELVRRAPTAADLENRPDGFFLDLPGDPLDPGCDYEEWFQRTGRDFPTSVYAHVATDPAHPGMLALQYWFFWIYNDWNDLHEGDWEMVQILFPVPSAQEALGTTPSTVAFAQHEGAEVADWNSGKVLRDGDHIAVYPSEGSHASYYTQSRWFGKSASAGFGCDNTAIDDGLDAELLRPATPVVGDGAPMPSWLTFAGRWGEKAPSFNNGPTGPNMKRQWTAPVSWQQDGRPDAAAVPPAAGDAVDAFCGLVAAGSSLFVSLLDHPIVVACVFILVIALLVFLIRSTRWRGSPSTARARRSAGQMLVGSWRQLRLGWLPYLAVAGAIVAGSGLSIWLQGVVLRPHTRGLTTVGAAPDGWLDYVWLGLIAILAGLGAFLAVAVAEALTRDLPSPTIAAGVVGSGTWRGWWRLIVSYLLIGLCAITLIGLPVAVYLTARWAVASPVAVVEDARLGEAGRRSASLVAGRRLRAFAVTVAAIVLGTGAGAVAGALVVLVTPWPFWVGNLVAVVGFAIGLCWIGAVFTLHYFDLRLGAAEEPSPPSVSDNLQR